MNKKILIVDDHDKFCEMLGTILSSKGFETTKALNGKEALREVSNFVPDLIILDIIMPGMSGTEVCEKIKKNVSSRKIPVLMMTGFASEDNKVDSYIAGADDYIIKPFETDHFLDRVNELLGQST